MKLVKIIKEMKEAYLQGHLSHAREIFTNLSKDDVLMLDLTIPHQFNALKAAIGITDTQFLDSVTLEHLKHLQSECTKKDDKPVANLTFNPEAVSKYTGTETDSDWTYLKDRIKAILPKEGLYYPNVPSTPPLPCVFPGDWTPRHPAKRKDALFPSMGDWAPDGSGDTTLSKNCSVFRTTAFIKRILSFALVAEGTTLLHAALPHPAKPPPKDTPARRSRRRSAGGDTATRGGAAHASKVVRQRAELISQVIKSLAPLDADQQQVSVNPTCESRGSGAHKDTVSLCFSSESTGFRQSTTDNPSFLVAIGELRDVPPNILRVITDRSTPLPSEGMLRALVLSMALSGFPGAVRQVAAGSLSSLPRGEVMWAAGVGIELLQLAGGLAGELSRSSRGAWVAKGAGDPVMGMWTRMLRDIETALLMFCGILRSEYVDQM
eukprot:gnl/Dysnectes_brevis/3008_a3716_632.p1 GENE.gnl/Dysnectes_brevis/3008_a3716_632~~gnl/Dysnectes_brevis/3008_a3716_632.p1  ORF type:complete len:435 (+),score=83.69 gnl/Dysnectes_brevis/3008_a3716_632:142-1446(+)